MSVALPLRRLLTCILLGLCLAPATGCNALRLRLPAGDKPGKPEKEQDASLAEPSKHEIRVSQFVFRSDFELQRDLPLFTELSEMREQVFGELHLPTSAKLVHVYVFENRDRYERYMKAKYPDLPRRRAFFVAQPRTGVNNTEDLLVYTYWGDRVREDLRHELTHALLHSVLKNVPLWLDEGLAEYFEVPPEKQGVNVHHLEVARRSKEPLKANLERLEQLSEVAQMTPAEYREAWGWAHLMLHDKPEAKKALLAYLQQLRTNPTPGPLQPRLALIYGDVDLALEKHLGRLERSTAQR